METVEIRATCQVLVTARYPKKLWDELKNDWREKLNMSDEDIKHDLLCDFLDQRKEVCMGGDRDVENHWVPFFMEMGVEEFTDIEIEGDDEFE